VTVTRTAAKSLRCLDRHTKKASEERSSNAKDFLRHARCFFDFVWQSFKPGKRVFFGGIGICVCVSEGPTSTCSQTDFQLAAHNNSLLSQRINQPQKISPKFVESGGIRGGKSSFFRAAAFY